MRKVNDLSVGWLNTSVKRIVEEHNCIRGFSFALLTSLDSTRRLPSSIIGQKIISSHPSCRSLGSGIVVASNIMFDLDKALGLFFGFDEIWFFDIEPPEEMPEGVWLVGPYNIDSEELPPMLEQWMGRSSCRLGLGDGVGLNYATNDREIASVIDNSSVYP